MVIILNGSSFKTRFEHLTFLSKTNQSYTVYITEYKQGLPFLATLSFSSQIPADIYLFKVNNRNTTKRYEICPKLTIKTPERRQ